MRLWIHAVYENQILIISYLKFRFIIIIRKTITESRIKLCIIYESELLSYRKSI